MRSQDFGDRVRPGNEREINENNSAASGVRSDPIRVEEVRRNENRNAVLDAAPVSMKCQPYEGQGISARMPGGMPSGVPPSVCPSPADAMHQQYVTRIPVGIPGGMPSGVNPSVCLPLADAMCQQYVNSHVMKSQLANRDMMRCSPEMSVPIESVRYLTPNTCAPVNARVLREPAISYSQSQGERTCSSEADSGFGCMSRPSPKSTVTGSGNEDKHASFDDAKTVLVCNSDVSETQENNGSTDKKSARKESSSKNSASSTGDKGRTSSSTASQSDSNRIVPETSSEESSTESDDDESLLSRSKHVLKPPKFNGKTSFESFWAQFQNCASHNQWSRTKQLVYLKNALEKDATNVLWDYGTEVTDSLSGLTRTLKMRFGGENFAEKNHIELKTGEEHLARP